MLSELQLDDNAPWKQRFRAPVIGSTQLAQANRTRGLAVSNHSGAFQLYAWDIATGDLRALTQRPEGKAFGVIGAEGQFVYYLDDQQGNEIGHFVRVPFTGGAAQDLTPDMPPYASWSFATSSTGGWLGFLAANADGFHVYVLRETAAPRLIYHGKKLSFGPVFSFGGDLALITTAERSDLLRYSLVAIDTATGERLAELWDGPEASVEAVAFAPLPNDFRLLATTNLSGAKRPLVWNPRSGERTDLPLPELEGEVIPVDWSPDGEHILLCQFHHAIQQLYLYHLANRSLSKLTHPSGTYALAGTYFNSNTEIFAQWQDSQHPSRLIALEATSGEQTRTVLAAGEAPPGRRWQSVTFPSTQGQMIQGWLARPDGDGPFPTILETHGGPTSAVTELFAPMSQAWLDHGFAFLTINYRGSTTFGKDFEESIYGDLGHWEVDDMAAARDWLVALGLAQPDSILITGWSYGGYLTLQALGKRPDLWAGGMAGIAIADWAVMYEDEADTLKGYQVALFGGKPEEKPEQYAASSPITYAEQVAAPVLVIQGRNDSRCPARQLEQYEQKLKALGKPIDVHWFEAGHGSLVVEQRIEHQERMLRFAYRTLG